jgi:hypothetical protein
LAWSQPRNHDLQRLGGGCSHQTTDRIEYHLELVVILALQGRQFARQIFVRCDCLWQTMNARMISMFAWTARSLLRTDDSMAMPCSRAGL